MECIEHFSPFSNQKIIANSFKFKKKPMYNDYYNDDTVSGAINTKQKKDFNSFSQKSNKICKILGNLN